MPLHYVNLDTETRSLMADEIQMDTAEGKLYLSSYLSDAGKRDWAALLLEAAQNGSDEEFARALRQGGRLLQMVQRRKPSGGYTMAKVPVTAAETLAEGEFNRFYIRALCRRALNEGRHSVQVYRAKHVENPRRESEEMLGQDIDPSVLLNDLRQHVGVETGSGFPGPNSGISVRFA